MFKTILSSHLTLFFDKLSTINPFADRQKTIHNLYNPTATCLNSLCTTIYCILLILPRWPNLCKLMAKGKKTYAVALATVVFAGTGFFLGQLSGQEAVQLVSTALLAAGLRSGMK